jgi:hypothetical protein
MIQMKSDHQAMTPSCITVADRTTYANAIQLRAWPCLPRVDVKSVHQMLSHASAVDARNDEIGL